MKRQLTRGVAKLNTNEPTNTAKVENFTTPCKEIKLSWIISILAKENLMGTLTLPLPRAEWLPAI